jgi:hypothetical protein
MYVCIYQYNLYMQETCMLIRYLVSTTQVLKDIEFERDDWCECGNVLLLLTSYHHQPINVPSAGAQAFLNGYTEGERTIIHHAGLVWIGGC